MPTAIFRAISFLSVALLLLPVSGLNHEGTALLAWLSSFNSSLSSALFSSWDPTHSNPCRWAFVSCSSSGLVSEICIRSISLHTTFPSQILSFRSLANLVLYDTNITGEIPRMIANLTSLLTLDLRFNALSGKFPPGMGNLSSLRSLYLSSNLLKGPIPREICNCSELRVLELVDNQLTGTIPEEIGRLSSLEIFRAGGNSGISGEIPPSISNCKGLVLLGLADTAVSGRIPSGIGELRNLRTLSIYTSNLSGSIPPEIANCSAMEYLFLYENQLSQGIPSELGLLKNLKVILLWKNKFTGDVPESIGNCTGLTVMDLSLNYLTGEVPASFAKLMSLEVFLLSYNNISGRIPGFVGNLSRLSQLELDNNRFSGELPTGIGQLKELTQFFAWQNQLHGNVPSELGGCGKLESLDLSYNFLTGFLPVSLFRIKSLTELMLISNGFFGDLPPDIGNCTKLVRLRLGFNRFSGRMPAEIGHLRNLSFLELSENMISGEIPSELGNCTRLEMIDLHENRIQGTIPSSLEHLRQLNVIDLSRNRIAGPVPEVLGKLRTLSKLMLGGNYLSGSIPKTLGLCGDLEFLDMSSNRIAGPIPEEIGYLQGLDIVLNLSWNYLSGPLPRGLSNLSKLASLDVSHNMLTGSLDVLGGLDNLVFLDVSYNNFSGYLPETTFFRQLPAASFAGNQQLCANRSDCLLQLKTRSNPSRRAILSCGIALTVGLAIMIVWLLMWTRKLAERRKKEGHGDWQWDFTVFQKVSFSVDDVVQGLSETNVIGRGSSGVVYRVETGAGLTIAVKKLRAEKKNEQLQERDCFTTEVKIHGSIKHKNIVRLLGCCVNRHDDTRLLIFDHISNGSLDDLLHGSTKMTVAWESRYKIALGAAQGLAYLHHDCNPPIIHRDIKARNILVGLEFEPYLADFGLAKPVDRSGRTMPCGVVAGSYGYIAPEYSYSPRITEKSDVYSYGVVLLEILTGLQPSDARIQGAHIVDWVRRELRAANSPAAAVLDGSLRNQTDVEVQEMVQVLGVALLCVNPAPEERPSMRDVAALLREIRIVSRHLQGAGDHPEKGFENCANAAACSSFSRASVPMISSSSSTSSSL
ncbi:unnamed protein product [Musa banksii]